jgi:hypothetical protein
VLGRRKRRLGRCGLTARAREKKKEKGRWPKEKKGRGKRDGPVGGKEREERGKGFSFFLLNFFSNSFFKHSNFNQTEIHAFES